MWCIKECAESYALSIENRTSGLLWGVCGILLEGLWTVHTLVAGDFRPRCGHHKDPESVRAGLGVERARAFGLAFWVYAQGVCVRRVCVSQTSTLFANSGSEDQGRWFESELLGLKVGGQIQDF
jgi:hypothetical protein